MEVISPGFFFSFQTCLAQDWLCHDWLGLQVLNKTIGGFVRSNVRLTSHLSFAVHLSLTLHPSVFPPPTHHDVADDCGSHHSFCQYSRCGVWFRRGRGPGSSRVSPPSSCAAPWTPAHSSPEKKRSNEMTVCTVYTVSKCAMFCPTLTTKQKKKQQYNKHIKPTRSQILKKIFAIFYCYWMLHFGNPLVKISSSHNSHRYQEDYSSVQCYSEWLHWHLCTRSQVTTVHRPLICWTEILVAGNWNSHKQQRQVPASWFPDLLSADCLHCHKLQNVCLAYWTCKKYQDKTLHFDAFGVQ